MDRFRSKVLAALGVVAAIASTARAVVYRGDVDSGDPGAPTSTGLGSASSDYTTLNNSALYQSVGELLSQHNGIGSAILINSQYILTASHLTANDSPGQVTFTPYGSSTPDAGVSIVNPSDGGDLSIVKLATPLTGINTPILYTGNGEQGNVGTMVGYGYGGVGAASGNQGTRHAGQNVMDIRGSIATVNGNDVITPDSTGPYLFTDFDSPTDPTFSSMGSSTPITLEAGISYGDSGGGMFMTSGGITYLVGVTDAYSGSGFPGTYGDTDLFLDVSYYQGFIASNVPEPASLAIAAMAGLGLLSRRARRS